MGGAEPGGRGPERRAGRFAEWLLSGWRPWLLVVLLGLVLYLPGLGTSGLWDPWEPHYAEVAREMVESGNWLEPTWEHSPGQSTRRRYFFSKPVLIMWLMALPMKLFGVHHPAGGIAAGAEWYIRFPFVLCALLGLLGVFWMGRHFFGVRVGLLGAVILATCPQYYFIARQAMTDMPLVGLMTAGVALLLVGGFGERPRPGLIYGGYLLLGLATLAKGLTGLALPGLVFLVYLLISGQWQLLRRLRVVSGGLLALCVAAPWYVYISVASAARRLLDDEGKTFFQRFFLHDHLFRLAQGVHGDRGTFDYFLRELGLGCHPWSVFMGWSLFSFTGRLQRQPTQPRQQVELLLWIWVVAGYALFSLSMTKFHHYALPVVPAAALLCARWLDGWSRGEFRLGLPGGLLLLLGLVLTTRDITLMPKELVDLFVYNYTRAFPKAQALVGQVGYALIFGPACLALVGVFLLRPERLARWSKRLLVASALLGAAWGGWYFMNAMGPHWSQRHLFDTYFALRQPDEPIGAYLMNWRGETFYSRNSVTQLKTNTRLGEWLRRHRQRRRFLLVEQHRLAKLKNQLSPEERRSLKILDRSCNKFYLVSIDPSPPKKDAAAPPPASPPAGS